MIFGGFNAGRSLSRYLLVPLSQKNAILNIAIISSWNLDTM